MKELIQFFQGVARTGEIITVAYDGGSRPGEARQLTISSCTETDLSVNEENARFIKQYKVSKILWAEDSSGTRIMNSAIIEDSHSQLPQFDTLQQYAYHLSPELETAGWNILRENDFFGVGTCFKNGKPKKTPSIAVTYIERNTDDVFDPDRNEFVAVKKEPTGRERPWRLDSWRFKEGKSFRLLHSAIEAMTEEVRASTPQGAKDMYAGH